MIPAEFSREQHQELFRNRLRRRHRTVTAAFYEAVFGAASRLYEGAARTLGVASTAMKPGGAGESIKDTTMEGPSGRRMLATVRASG